MVAHRAYQNGIYTRESILRAEQHFQLYASYRAHDWVMSASKEATSQETQGNVGPGAINSLLVIIYSAGPSCSTLPTAQREACAYNLAANSPGSQLQGGFQTNQAVVQQLRLISFSLLGVRNTVTFSATQNNTQNVSAFNQLAPIGSGPSQNNVDQLGASVNWSHQFDATVFSLVRHLPARKAKAPDLTARETTQQYMSVNFTTQLGPQTNAGINARRVEADGTTSYTENALTATVSHRF